MIFETLQDSIRKNELILLDNSYCRWHLRKDGQITIYEIFSLSKGHGKIMLEKLKSIDGAKSIFAKCPSDLDANIWYYKQGFICIGEEITKTGRRLKLWQLILNT